MARKPRFIVPGLPHHITQRGNNKQRIFDTDRDRQNWLHRFREHADALKVKVLAFCLMTNHVHVIAVPEDCDSLGRLMRRVQADYARVVNFHRGACGHLWQGRYYSCALAELDALAAMAYVERNPVRAGMVSDAWQYPWSSARTHVESGDPEGWIDLSLWSQYYSPERWREVLRYGIREEAWRERFRQATRRGMPLGPEEYIRMLSRRFGMDLHMRPVGRPRKGAASNALTANGGG